MNAQRTLVFPPHQFPSSNFCCKKKKTANCICPVAPQPGRLPELPHRHQPCLPWRLHSEGSRIWVQPLHPPWSARLVHRLKLQALSTRSFASSPQSQCHQRMLPGKRGRSWGVGRALGGREAPHAPSRRRSSFLCSLVRPLEGLSAGSLCPLPPRPSTRHWLPDLGPQRGGLWRRVPDHPSQGSGQSPPALRGRSAGDPAGCSRAAIRCLESLGPAGSTAPRSRVTSAGCSLHSLPPPFSCPASPPSGPGPHLLNVLITPCPVCSTSPAVTLPGDMRTRGRGVCDAKRPQSDGVGGRVGRSSRRRGGGRAGTEQGSC